MNPKTKQIISEAFYREYEWGRKGYLGLWWGDEEEIKPGSKISVVAACFSIYAYQELQNELKNIDELRFIFTSPTFYPGIIIKF